MVVSELVDLLCRVIRCKAYCDDGKSITYVVERYHDKPRMYNLSAEVVDEMTKYDDTLSDESGNAVCIQSKKYCEFILRDSSRMIVRYMETKVYHDNDNMLTYRLGRPSSRMIVAILKYADSHAEVAQELRERFNRISSSIWAEEDDAVAVLSHFTPIRCSFLQIQLDDINPYDKVDFLSLCTSFCFTCGYNLGKIILPLSNLSDIIDTSNIRRFRRGRADEMEPPKRKYINELVHFYIRGNSGESRDYQFLSYYHVLEYFFEKVYTDKLVERMRLELTKPGFSYKRDKDLLMFEKTIRKTFKDLSSSSGVNESEALLFTLKKYVPDLDSFKDNLNAVSSTIVDYLKTTASPFSGSLVNFDVADTDSIYKALTNRIYTTRNAIAHSKEALSKKKFVPYKHDRELVNEVMLIRIVAEEVIINSSREF